MHEAGSILRITSLQAPNQDFIIHGVSVYLREQLGIQVKAILDATWQARAQMLVQNQIQMAWICGLPYIQHADRQDSSLELLAAPVMQAERYQNRPVYFSDVLVRVESPYQRFADLRGARWAYNEPNSHSGYNITCYTLARLNYDADFFGSAIQAGSHQQALAMLLAEQIDAAAIDSTVLELEAERNDQIQIALRVIASLGPSPIPPLVIGKSVTLKLREAIRAAILAMHTHLDGRRTLQSGRINHFAAVADADYEPIREMTRVADGISL